MSNIANPAYNYTFNGDVNKRMFIDPALKNPDILSLFSVENNVNYKKQLNIVGQLGKVTKGVQGCGTQATTGAPLSISNRTLEVCGMQVELNQCYDTFEQTVIGEMLNANTDRPKLWATAIGNVLQAQVREAISQDIFRIFSFADTTSGDPYYNMCNGLWPTLIAGGSSYEVTVVNNSISSLAANDIKAEFLALWEGADILLKQLPMNEKIFGVTGNVYESLMSYYENNANSGGFVLREEGGVVTLRYRGIKVQPFYGWDQHIAADNLGNNTRILYTTPKNHIIGVQRAATLGSTDLWYDMDTKLNKIRSEFYMGYNYIHDKLQAISYGNV